MRFWDVYETELARSVEKTPSAYALKPGQTANEYAALVRPKMQAAGMAHCNLSNAFRRTAKRLGIPYTRKALAEAAMDEPASEVAQELRALGYPELAPMKGEGHSS